MFSILILIVIAVVATSTVVMKRREASNGSNRFSVSSVAEKLSLLVKRFPISVLLVVGLAVLFFLAVNNNFDDISYRLWFFFSVGAFIATVATLFAEDFFENLKSYGISLFAILLWGVYCFFLPEKTDDMQISKWIEISVISGTAFFAMLFISFLRKNKDRAFWNFATQTLFQIVLAGVFGAILFSGLSLALLAIDSLFSVSIDEKLYGNLAVICFALFTPLYFLANIPNKTEKQSDEISYTKVQEILALYILTPILAVYAVILYAYLFKIIVAWELPNGWVSWLVSALALGGLLVITFLYPVREESKNKMADFLSRWFGLLILPLLVLMTIGIFRRIGDYGITINRCYVLLLNFWFYGIYIYLFFSQSRHIKWIIISPIVVALLTSISVWGVANITKNSLTKEVSVVLNKQVSAEEARAIFVEMTQAEKDRVRSTLQYLYRNFGKESVQPFFTDRVADGWWNFTAKLGLNEVTTIESVWLSYKLKNKNTLNIEKYSAFLSIVWRSDFRTNENNIIYSAENEMFSMKIVEKRVVSIPMRELITEWLDADKETRDQKEWTIQGDDYIVLIKEFRGHYYSEEDNIKMTYFEGYLFYK